MKSSPAVNYESPEIVSPEPVEGYCFGTFLPLRLRSGNKNAEFRDSQSPGFTLVETLVGMGVFLVIAVIVSQVFATAQTLGRVHALSQQIQNDLRSALEAVALEVRGGQIDYPRYGSEGITIGVGSRTSRLFLRDEDGTRIELASSAQTGACTGSGGVSCCPNAASTPCLVKVVVDPSDVSQTQRVTALTAKSTRVVGQFPVFFLFPERDPASGATPQPVLTVVLCAAPTNIPSSNTCDPSAEPGVSSGVRGAKPLYLQSTLTPRNQPR